MELSPGPPDQRLPGTRRSQSRRGKGKAEGRHPAGKPVQVGPVREVLFDSGRIPSDAGIVQGDSEGSFAGMLSGRAGERREKSRAGEGGRPGYHSKGNWLALEWCNCRDWWAGCYFSEWMPMASLSERSRRRRSLRFTDSPRTSRRAMRLIRRIVLQVHLAWIPRCAWT